MLILNIQHLKYIRVILVYTCLLSGYLQLDVLIGGLIFYFLALSLTENFRFLLYVV